MACFIFKYTDVNIDNENIKLEVSQSDISDIKSTIQRFKNSTNQLSNGKMTAEYDIYEISEPITSLSYDEKFGYYVGPEDVEKQIREVIQKNNYDHIFIVIRLRR